VERFEEGRYPGLTYQEQRQQRNLERSCLANAREEQKAACEDIRRLKGSLASLGERFEAAVTTATAALDATKAETRNDAERQNLAYALKEAAAARDESRRLKDELAALEEKYVVLEGEVDLIMGAEPGDGIGWSDEAQRKLTACESVRDEEKARWSEEAQVYAKALAEKASEKVEAAERGRDDAVRERDAAVTGLAEGKRLWDEEVQKREAAETGRGEASAARDEAEQEVARLEAALEALGTRFEAAAQMASNFLEASKKETSTLKADLETAARAKHDAETARRALAADLGVASAARDALQGELAETVQDRDALAAERLDAVAALAASRTAGDACAARLAALDASIVVPPPPPNPPQKGCAPGCFG
jgi:hypothetical protein